MDKAKTAEVDAPLDAVGFEFEDISANRVTGKILVSPKSCQPFKVLHGGVSAMIAEGMASVGAHVASGFKRVPRQDHSGVGGATMEGEPAKLREQILGVVVSGYSPQQHARPRALEGCRQESQEVRETLTTNIRSAAHCGDQTPNVRARYMTRVPLNQTIMDVQITKPHVSAKISNTQLIGLVLAGAKHHHVLMEVVCPATRPSPTTCTPFMWPVFFAD
ncbi:hypothetical protein EUGRSUZ_H04138 [Eucalyptus grandis]|uniref:Uncharacterized protein n=2 Tax=Eucalyptus grandis TaxID=71139 RepID=A0ACC3JW02_EUCGR|nr:hypothetical protein EUGRSUZ_H04138 [Eucalyptus grandis]